MNRYSWLFALALLTAAGIALHAQAGVPVARTERCPAVLAVDVGPDINGLIAGLNDPAINGQVSVVGLSGATINGQPCIYTEPPAPPLPSTLAGQ